MKQYSLVLMLVWLALVSFGQNRLPEVPKSQGYTDLSIQERGFWHAIEANLESSIILEKDNTQRTGLMYTAGYRFSEFLKLGVGVGVNWYFNNNNVVRSGKESLTMPLCFNVRGNLMSHYDREIVPYWSVTLGHAFGDGQFVSPCVGLRLGSVRGAWLVGLNYTLAKVKTNELFYRNNISFLGIKAGYEF